MQHPPQLAAQGLAAVSASRVALQGVDRGEQRERIVDLRLARSGARAAMLVDDGQRTTLRVSGVVRGSDGVPNALTEPILLGGAPRTVAIANGTLAAAVGLGLQLWIPGVVLWIVGHSLAVWGARVDPQFMQVFARHIKHRPLLDV